MSTFNPGTVVKYLMHGAWITGVIYEKLADNRYVVRDTTLGFARNVPLYAEQLVKVKATSRLR